MNGPYSNENIEKLKRDTLTIIRKRVIAECRLQLLEEEGKLERMCQIGREESTAFEERCKRMSKLYEVCSAYVAQEIEVVQKYSNACLAYQSTLN